MMGMGTSAALMRMPTKASQIVVRPCANNGTPDQRADFWAVGAIGQRRGVHWDILSRHKTEAEAMKVAEQFRACLK